MRILATCISAVALAASIPALSQGNSGNRGGGGPQAERGPQGGPPGRGNDARGPRYAGERGGPPHGRGNGGDRGPGAGRGNADPGSEQGDRPENRGNDGDRPDQAAERGRPDAPGSRGRGNVRAPGDVDRGPPAARGRPARDDRVLARFADNDFYRARRFADEDYRRRIWDLSRARGRSCPPGLARQNELCMPPGHYRKLFPVGARFDRQGAPLPDWFRSSGLTGLLFGRDAGRFDYRYIDGYAYRLDPETRLVLAAMPVLGGALGIGQLLPDELSSYNVPLTYRPIYADDAFDYRYGANAIYRVDPGTRRILGVSELLANDFVVGEPVPPGYGVYNVPYVYRDRYYDTADTLYRYNNGRIYRIDPDSRLVLAAIDVLV